MKKGISIWSITANNLKEAFKIAKDAGFEGVEVDFTEDGEINLNTPKEQLEKIREQAKDAGVQLYSLATGLFWKYSITSDDSAQREKAKDIVKKQLEAASVLGCDTILVIPGAVSVCFAPELGVVDYQTAYDRALNAFKELAPYAEKLKVNIGLENVWNDFLLSPLEMRDFIDKIDSHYVGSYFDVGNVVDFGYPDQWIKILGKRIKKVHFKDYRKDVGSLAGFVDLLAGDVNYPDVIEAFKQTGYDGWVTAEMIPPYKTYSNTIVENTSNAMDKILGRKS